MQVAPQVVTDAASKVLCQNVPYKALCLWLGSVLNIPTKIHLTENYS